MISAETFRREMTRLASSDPERGVLGLHVAAWMLNDGRFDEVLYRQLLGQVWKQLRNEADLKAFVDYLLDEKARGRVHFFPKLAEMKTYLSNYLKSTGRNDAPRQIRRSYVPPPPPSPEIRRTFEEAARWWVELSREEREASKELLIKVVTESGNGFVANYLRERSEEQWMDPLQNPTILVPITDLHRTKKVSFPA